MSHLIECLVSDLQQSLKLAADECPVTITAAENSTGCD